MPPPSDTSPEQVAPGFNHVIDRNLGALADVQNREAQVQTTEERIAGAITRFTGSMTFVYVHLVLFGAWISANVGLLPVKPFDPSLVMLAMAASVEAIFLSTFVLISQNRMQKMATRQADLSLHVGLLAEHEITRLIKLTTAIAERLGIEEAQDPELPHLAKDVHPEQVLAKIEQTTKLTTP